MDFRQATSKQEALAELTAQIALGRTFMSRPLETHEALASASMERGTWTLKSKKLLHALLGDSASMAHFGHSRGDDASLEDAELSRFELEVVQFRQVVRDQMAFLESVALLLQRMA